MDLSPFTRCLSPAVAVAALDGPPIGVDIFEAEERLLSDRVSPARAAEFRLGRHVAHLALQQLGLEARPILRGPGREPIWPEGVVGSITHTGDRAIAAVALVEEAGGIGIDLEDSTRSFPALESQITVPDEATLLARMEKPARDAMVIETFSAKESIYKAFYPRVRRFFGFDAARIQTAGDHLVGYFTQVIDARYPVDRPMHIGRLWIDRSVLTWLVLPPDR